MGCGVRYPEGVTSRGGGVRVGVVCGRDCFFGRRSPEVGLTTPLDADFGLDLSFADGLLEGVVVAFVLVCVGLGERGERAVEGVVRAEVARDRDRVSAASVGACKLRPACL